MKIVSIVLLNCLLIFSIFGQKKETPAFNFDFETVENGKAKGWDNFGKGNYKLAIDTINVQSGRNSAVIAFLGEEAGYKAWSYTIPSIYKGKKIKLTGYIKTEHVIGGFAGLWMRIDPRLGFDNMKDQNIIGTTDWTKYEIEYNFKATDAVSIVIGGILVGKGKVWIDNLEVTIDGKTLDQAPKKNLLNAEKDVEFVEGSKIETIGLNDQRIGNLKQLGLIWGFVKYHHPNIAKGDYNWDFELFRILPEIIDATNAKERDKYLVEWIKKLGKFKSSKKRKKTIEDIKTSPDLDWIEGSGFSAKLKAKLKDIRHAKRKEKHFYIGLTERVGGPEFKNETSYEQMKYPDVGFRILSLYRYWNMIQYYFPYKNLIEEDWKNVLTEFIPKYIDAKNELEYNLVVLELIARVHDTHANVRGPNPTLIKHWGANYAPVEITFIENKAIVTGYFDEKLGKETGLIVGDNITKINNELIGDIIKRRLKYTPASNYPTQLRNLSRKLLRSNDSSINVEFVRDEKAKVKDIKVFSIKEVNIYKKYQVQDTCFRKINKDIAYINHGSLQRKYLPKLWKEIENTKGLIIDIRNYPSDFPLYELTQYLMPNIRPFVQFSNGSIKNPGLFVFSKTNSVGAKNKNYYKGRVVIIVNETSQSSAEFHAMAYRVHPNAIVIGSTTAGADGNVSDIVLPGNIRTRISGIGIYYPDGGETQRVGIVPDLEVKPTVMGIKNNQDELLEKAIELIEQK